jgi:hypothetical protein
MTIIGWITVVGVVMMLVSLFVAQAADGMRNRALFNLANALTLIGFIGIAIGVLNWLFGG